MCVFLFFYSRQVRERVEAGDIHGLERIDQEVRGRAEDGALPAARRSEGARGQGRLGRNSL